MTRISKKNSGNTPPGAIRTALFTGSFNPFTAGHADIAARALRLFDRLVIAVGVNAAKEADAADIQERAQKVRAYFADEPRVEVIVYTGLTVETAKRVGACALVRGVRSLRDFEYERDMADVNMRLAGIDTVILAARPELGAVSASLVRELDALGVDTTPFLPKK